VSAHCVGTKLPALQLSVLGGLAIADWPERLIFELVGVKPRLARALERISSWPCLVFLGLLGRCWTFRFRMSPGEEARGYAGSDLEVGASRS
jgi:hypothetical protein